ncbi:HAD-IB family hydrolase [Fusibacter tunisiensis]|uniref:phosphoserine phosphatase n=1 Tax=Fusibacter tunisiensis TaxID=1008308 RepID=A0ABS2MRP3_9FIRM|nr:HAD-IB family hydrolase [Fusibacter tunisiensis]MBM7562051.1 HAD superfamily hydrolase (TIGR01490 family) [Fusibacter tunisiensis]
MNIAAFLDIDGTLYRNSLMIEHFKKLVKYEVIDPGVWHLGVKDSFTEWRKRVGEYEDYMLELVNLYYDALKGRKASDLEFISNQVIALHGDIVYKYTRSQILWHKSQGHKVFFISGSPDFLVSKMASKYEIDGYRGTGYLVDAHGCFTGEVSPMWDSVNKNKAIDGFVKAFDIDLDKSYAYGDTNGDFSMLCRVGNPVAINPAKELLMHIKNSETLSKKATIIVERKDVIYQLPTSVSLIDESALFV